MVKEEAYGKCMSLRDGIHAMRWAVFFEYLTDPAMRAKINEIAKLECIAYAELALFKASI